MKESGFRGKAAFVKSDMKGRGFGMKKGEAEVNKYFLEAVEALSMKYDPKTASDAADLATVLMGLRMADKNAAEKSDYVKTVSEPVPPPTDFLLAPDKNMYVSLLENEINGIDMALKAYHESGDERLVNIAAEKLQIAHVLSSVAREKGMSRDIALLDQRRFQLSRAVQK
jgi:hypothetical protein